jgi:myo-inositol 2-dehydrogenase / D-chiro-inositol 1-dehydrogenase
MKIAVVGAGRMGQVHMQTVRDMKLDLAGICDLSQESLAAAGQRFDLAPERQFTDLSDLLREVRPDCLIVATTAPSHAEYTSAAAEAGVRFILCEKPMATSLADCDRMISVCKSNDVRLAINHQMRFMDYYREAKRLVQSEEFGSLASVTVVAGNFGLAMNGSHYFEMFRFMTDQPVNEVTAWFSNIAVPNPRGPQFEDCGGSVRAVNRNGQRLYLEMSPDQGHGLKVIYSGTYGVLVFDELSGVMQFSAREAQYRNLPTTRYGMPAIETTRQLPATSYDTLMPRVLRALITGDDIPSGEQGRMVVAALVAAHVSDEDAHRAVRLDSNLPNERVFPWA